MQNRNSKAPSIITLRAMADYAIAQASPDYLFIGRAKGTAPYKQSHPGRILHPEARGEDWTLEKNMAFMAGAIEANNTFLIVTPLPEIADRAKRGFEGKCFIKGKLGYTTAEILWLQDNGYTFETKHQDNPKLTWATPPKNKIESAVIRQYGHTGDVDDVTTKEQVERICSIAKIPSLDMQKREAATRNPNPRSMGSFWGEDRRINRNSNTSSNRDIAQSPAVDSEGWIVVGKKDRRPKSYVRDDRDIGDDCGTRPRSRK